MAFYPVAKVGEIPPGSRKIVEIEGRSVGVFNINGEFHAVRNQCPHAGAPLCVGPTVGLAQAEQAGEITYTRLGEILRCPWHAWEFDIKTGRSTWDPVKTRVKAYPVVVGSGSICAGEQGDKQLEKYDVKLESETIYVQM